MGLSLLLLFFSACNRGRESVKKVFFFSVRPICEGATARRLSLPLPLFAQGPCADLSLCPHASCLVLSSTLVCAPNRFRRFSLFDVARRKPFPPSSQMRPPASVTALRRWLVFVALLRLLSGKRGERECVQIGSEKQSPNAFASLTLSPCPFSLPSLPGLLPAVPPADQPV